MDHADQVWENLTFLSAYYANKCSMSLRESVCMKGGLVGQQLGEWSITERPHELGSLFAVSRIQRQLVEQEYLVLRE